MYCTPIHISAHRVLVYVAIQPESSPDRSLLGWLASLSNRSLCSISQVIIPFDNLPRSGRGAIRVLDLKARGHRVRRLMITEDTRYSVFTLGSMAAAPAEFPCASTSKHCAWSVGFTLSGMTSWFVVAERGPNLTELAFPGRGRRARYCSRIFSFWAPFPRITSGI